jgi:uncharacterized protein (TIGR03000 family)
MTKFRLAFTWLVVAAAASVAAAQDDRQEPIRITVLVPADAQVEFDGYKTSSQGESRVYETPPLPVGSEHTYVLAVTSQGKTTTRKISVRYGGDNSFDFRAVSSQQDGDAQSDHEDKQTVTSKASRLPAAATINFRKELKLPLDSLSDLGSRIDDARRTPDPVALAHAASELAVAEKVSGKQASLTAKMLAKEAAELAGLRRQEKELRAVLEVNQQIKMEQDGILKLKQAIALSQAQTKADKEALEGNRELTWKPRQVVVNNQTTEYLGIYVNGYYSKLLLPGTKQTLIVDHRSNPTVLKAIGNETGYVWGPRYLWGQFDKYTWNIE